VQGAVIIAPNHKSFLDAFFVGIATHRHVRFMAKMELFKGPAGWLFLRLGAFPVRRGEADVDALETARAILAGGGLVVIFPEGTRVEQVDALGSPHHGAGRLALETGAPIVPAAITGTSHLWRGALPRLKRVQLTFLPAVAPEAPEGPEGATTMIDDRVWPAVRDEYGRLRARPGLIAAGLAALGIGGGLLAKRRLEARRATGLLSTVEPRKIRRRKARQSLRRRARLWRDR
jgi:1-acyl-sn-glycerol-3-phosphate acyltransferase